MRGRFARMHGQKNKGFTLVEMIVTLVCLSIMLSVSVGGLLAWQDWSDFNRENEYAQVLFTAAQNQLTEFATDGRLQDLQADLSSQEDLNSHEYQYDAFGLNLTESVGLLKNSEGQAYSLSTIFPESEGKANEKLYQDEIVALRAETGDYSEYLNDPEGMRLRDPETYWVFELLGAYVYDASILNGSRDNGGSGNGAAICVEITPEDGQVFAVLYSDRHDGFVYLNVPKDKNGTAEQNGMADIANRTESYRKDRMIGYYGVDTLYAATKNAIVKPSFSSVKLYNKDTFYLTCRLSAKDRSTLTSKLTYKLDLDGSKDVNDRLLTITLDGAKLKNAAYAERIMCPVSRYAEDKTEVPIGEFPVLAWVEADYTIHVILDAADIQATTELYKREIDDIRSVDRAAQTLFAKTYSFFRFGVEADNVYASVSATGEGVSASKTISNFGNLNFAKNQDAKHTCFAGESEREIEEKIASFYTIKNARHLYNVRYVEDLTYLETAGGNPDLANKIAGVSFTLKSDIDWNTFQENDGLYNSEIGNIRLSSLDDKLVNANGENRGKITRNNCDFPSFAQLRTRDAINGNGKTITGISVSELSNALYGLYTSNETDGTVSMEENRPTGLVNVNYGEIKGLTLDRLTVFGNNFVGGFTGINAGTVTELETKNTKEQSVISGKKHVGGIIGFQIPTDVDMKVEKLKNRAEVKGVEAVGGVLGMLRNDYSFVDFKTEELTELTSKQKDLLEDASSLKIKIYDCENYGAVGGLMSSELKGVYIAKSSKQTGPDVKKDTVTEPRYIGGIVGYCYNSYEDDTTKLSIEKCTSSPQYSREKLLTILPNRDKLDKHLKGAYVGGIVGYNYFGQINNCSTLSDSGQEGYLFGYCYVGGIVGYNIGPASGIIGSDTSKQGENNNHIIAYEYAGGITGCNAGVMDQDSAGHIMNDARDKDPEKLIGLLLPDSKRNLHVKIDNWVNKGIVIAVNGYSGGITGYNSGYIYRCNSDVPADAADMFFATLYSGDYAGGIAGYNNGIIGNTERIVSEDGASSTIASDGSKFKTVCYVKGHNYVGGIVGYNDVDSIVEDYEVASGYVLGDAGSCFVGGYAGLNASVDLLMNLSVETPTPRLIFSNPNRVKGDYFVGGNIGANIINMADNQSVSQIHGVFKTDNFLGILEGKAFVGGFVGYNLLFDNLKSADWIRKDEEGYRGGVFVLQKKLVASFYASDAVDTLNSIDKLREKKVIVDNLNEKLDIRINSSVKELHISGRGTESTKVSFGTISGEIYVGGVMGYNDENTKLLIQNVENATAIEAVNAIVYSDEQILREDASGNKTYRTTDYIGNPMLYQYSYAGGIIGKVGQKTTLVNCWNAPSGTVTTKGTYTGGLCEVNVGTITDCRVSSFGSSVQDYVGGLCGLNKGVIKGCSFAEKTVSGRNVVGGIAAENFGTIQDIALQKPVLLVEGRRIGTQDKDGVSGLYAGYNGEKGHIILKTDIRDVSVTSSGRYVGAVVGVNEGIIDNLKKIASENADDSLIITGCVNGYQTVGGLIGLNKNADSQRVISGYTNQVSVIAVNGNAGGIIGENRSQNSIKNCINDAVVIASDSGNAGGITAVNDGLISSCYDYRTVSAPEGMCGGIVALNGVNGEIRSCYVMPKAGDEPLTFRSTRAVGAVAAQNAGHIRGNILTNVKVTNETTRMFTSIGIVVGDNQKTGIIELADSSKGTDKITKCQAVVQSNYCYVGGIAGINAGKIQGSLSESDGEILSIVNCNLVMENASIASMGGVAGKNTGSIKNIAVDAEIQGELGSKTSGYGGIAGYSGYESRDRLAESIQTANTQMADVNYPVTITNCSFDGIINASGSSGAPVRIGGITGVNAYGSKLEDCYVGTRAEDVDGNSSDTTYVTAGDYVNKTAESVSKTDTKSYANLGGIAGDNYGFISACDNANHSTDTVKVIGFAGETGGIAGYNYEYGIVSGYLDENGVEEHILSTGKKWTVEQRCSSNDRGPGGIIGKSVSAETMSFVKNYAPVTCLYTSNSYVGGLIGILGQQYDFKTKFYKCENYGNITSNSSAGGMVGMLESNGADFDTCSNWGNVQLKRNNYYGGGFVARHYAFIIGTDFKHCANHGKVYGNANSLGGFVGDESEKIGTPVSHLYDCVNTGIVQKGTSDTIQNNTGSFFGRSQGRIIMELCRNYNTQKNANGFIGSGSDLRFKNCLDNSGVGTNSTFTPFGGGSGWSTNMFYLDSKSETTFGHENYGVYFSFHEGPNGDFRYANQSYRWDLRDQTFLFAEPDKSNKLYLDSSNRSYSVKQLNISLSYDDESQGIDSLVVYLWNGSDVINSAPSGNNTVTATFVYSDGTTATLDKQTKNGTYDVTEDARVVLKNPSADKYPKQIRVTFDNQYKNIDMRGICYIPAAESATKKEVVCTYLGDKTDTTFNISQISRIAGNGTITQYTYKDYKDSWPIKTSLPKDVWYCFPNDTMDIEWTPYSNYRLEYAQGDCADITFDVNNGENATGMDSFVFYLSNENTNAQTTQRIYTYCYEYSVTFTDVTGKSITTDVVSDAKGYDPSEPDYREKSRQQVKVPEELDSHIASIQLHIKTIKRTWIENGKQKEGGHGWIYFRGFGWIPDGAVKEEKMAAGKCESDSAFYDRIYANDGDSRYMKNIHLKTDERDGKFYVYVPYDYDTGFYLENNPIDEAYYADVSDYTESLNKGVDTGSRIGIYEELDPKYLLFSEALCTVNKKLATPSNLTVKQENGCLSYEWKKSPNAYAYEVSYDVVDDSGRPVCPSHVEIIGSLQLTYSIDIDNAWSENGYHIRFRVRALNAYHFAHDDVNTDDYVADYEKYDSDWTSLDQTVKKALPKPEVHMEVVAGNRMTFVLDNYEQYVEEGCTDCQIMLTYKDKQYNWNVAEDGKYRKPEFVNGSPSSPVKYTYYAEPNDSLKDTYTTSAVHSQRGEGHGNDNLLNYDSYCKTEMYGFYGEQSDAMEYRTVFTLNNNDSYLMTDITAYDEEIGATVVYDSEITHAANSNGGGTLKLTSTLKNLPDKWFSENKAPKITVRSYPYHSQFDIIHYGHDVAEGIELNGSSEENREVLAQIYDDVYFAADSDVPMSNCIWNYETNDLKDGYLLLKQEDGSYNIIYSSVIELSKAAAKERRETQGDAYREYYKFDVCYRIYANMDAETDGQTVVNSVDFQESYWKRDIQSTADNYKNTAAFSADRRFTQEIQPAPIPDGEVHIDTDENGRASYTFMWDKYYQDTACFNTSNKYYSNNQMKYLTNAQAGMFGTWDLYCSNYLKARLDNTTPTNQDGTARENFRKLMTAYYSSYSEASYRVDLIGTTLDGKEVVLDTMTVNDPTELGEMTSITDAEGTEKSLTTLDESTTTTYKMWNYQCTFTDRYDVWNTYPKLTARIMRLGSLKSVKFDRNGQKTDNNGATYILPRYTDKSIQLKLKLNKISKPSVTLLKENGLYITDDLVYEVDWGAITDEQQLEDLGGYLITVRVKTPVDVNDTAATHYYYVRDGVGAAIGPDMDALQGVVTDVTEYFEKTDNACKTRINLADFNTGDEVEISVKAIARSNAEIYEDGPDGVKTEMEIPARLHVPKADKLSVLLAKNPENMESGQTSEVQYAILPVENLPISMTQYKLGMQLQYAVEDYADETTAKIVLAVALYDEKMTGESNETESGTEDDMSVVSVPWNDGASETLYTKSEPLSLGKASDGTKVILDLTQYEQYPGEYAGKWLKVALRATSDTKIDSQWSDQDPEDETINYVWIPIPSIILDDVDLNEGSELNIEEDETPLDIVRYYYEEAIHDSVDESLEPEQFTEIATKTLCFAEDKNVDGYHIEVTGKQPEANPITGVLPPALVYDLYLQRHMEQKEDGTTIFDGTWDVYLYMAGMGVTDESEEDDTSATTENHPLCEQKEEAEWIGRLAIPFENHSDTTEAENGTQSNATEHEWKEIIDIDGINKAYRISNTNIVMTMQLRYVADENETGMIQIVLPDITKVGESTFDDRTEYFTSKMKVSQFVKDVRPYIAGRYGRYQR